MEDDDGTTATKARVSDIGVTRGAKIEAALPQPSHHAWGDGGEEDGSTAERHESCTAETRSGHDEPHPQRVEGGAIENGGLGLERRSTFSRIVPRPRPAEGSSWVDGSGDDNWTPAALSSAFTRAPRTPPRMSSCCSDGNNDEASTKVVDTSPIYRTTKTKLSKSKSDSVYDDDRAANVTAVVARDKLEYVTSAPSQDPSNGDKRFFDCSPQSWLSRGEAEGLATSEGIVTTSAQGQASPLRLPRELVCEDDRDDEEVVVPFLTMPPARELGQQHRKFLSIEDKDRDNNTSTGDVKEDIFDGREGLYSEPLNRGGDLLSGWRSKRSTTQGSSVHDSVEERDEFITFRLPGQAITPSTVASSPCARSMVEGAALNSDDRRDGGFGGAKAMPHNNWLGRRTAAEHLQLTDLDKTNSSLEDAEVAQVDHRPRRDECTICCGESSTTSSPSAGSIWWLQNISRIFDRCQRIGDVNYREDDDASRMRVWNWWDNFRRAPGLVARFFACFLVISLLWLTSLGNTVEFINYILPSPTLQAAISAVVHAYYITKEQHEAYEMCIARQSLFCDADLETFEALAREGLEAPLITTATTLEQAREWTTSCDASVVEAERSLKTWLAQGTGYVIIYSGNCTGSEEDLVAGLLGDMSSSREYLHMSNDIFTTKSTVTVTDLSSYALERSAYDTAYIANKSQVVHIDAGSIIYNMTFEVPTSLNATFQQVKELNNILLACVSLGGDEDGVCPGENARDLVDEARQELNFQLTSARNGFEEYAATFDQYTAGADKAYENMVKFYSEVMMLVEADVIKISGDMTWSTMTLNNFSMPHVTTPSSDGILTGYSDVMTNEEIWDEVSGAYDDFEKDIATARADISAQVLNMSSAWRDEVALVFANISIVFDLDDYEPPGFSNSSNENISNALIESTNLSFSDNAVLFSELTLTLLDSLGPRGFNLSFPETPSLNSSFTAGSSTAVSTPNIIYDVATYTIIKNDLSSWRISAANIAILLLAADYFFRFSSTLRMFIRFWSRAGLGLPDADLRVDKNISRAKTLGGDMGKAIAKMLLHPLTKMVAFGIIAGLVAYNMAKIYVPFLSDYRAGCIERTQNGSSFTQNMYTIAYNYATADGNSALLNYQLNHTSRREILCMELSSDLEQYLSEANTELTVMYETHYFDVTVANLLETCLDTDGMDALYAEACCGLDGYSSSCATDSALECPLNYASGVGEPFSPVGIAVSNKACTEATVEMAHWQVKSGFMTDCDILQSCDITCPGPNEELLQAIILHAGCTMECLLHTTVLGIVAIIVVFVFVNMSRIVIISGLIKLNWRLMHADIFTYKGTCTRTGKLIAFDPNKRASNSPSGDDAAGNESTAQPCGRKRCVTSPSGPERRRSMATKRIGTSLLPLSVLRRGRKNGASAVAPPCVNNEHQAKGSTIPRQGHSRKRHTGESARSKGGGEVGEICEGCGEKRVEVRRQAHEQVIADAVEEVIHEYEKGARWRIWFGILFNLPWVIVLWRTSENQIVYNQT